MGMTHGNANTFPHLAKPICYVEPTEVRARRPRRSSSCSATTATAPTASGPASSTSSTTGASSKFREVLASDYLPTPLRAAARRRRSRASTCTSAGTRRATASGSTASASRTAASRTRAPSACAPACGPSSRRFGPSVRLTPHAGPAAVRPRRRRKRPTIERLLAEHGIAAARAAVAGAEAEHGLPGDPDLRPGHLRSGAGACRASSTSWKPS